MDLVRLLLLNCDGDQEAATACKNFSEGERLSHIKLLMDAHLLEGLILRNGAGEMQGAIGLRLTKTGHTFVQAVGDDRIWNKVKEQMENEIKQKLGLH